MKTFQHREVLKSIEMLHPNDVWFEFTQPNIKLQDYLLYSQPKKFSTFEWSIIFEEIMIPEKKIFLYFCAWLEK